MSSSKRYLGNLSLAGKLTAIGVVAATAALVLAGTVLIGFDVVAEYRDEIRAVRMIARVAQINSTAAVSSGDAAAASEILSSLRANQHIIVAAINLPDGRVLARYDRDIKRPAALSPVSVLNTREASGLDWKTRTIKLSTPIEFEHQEIIGTLSMDSDLKELQTRVTQDLAAFTVVFIAGGLVSFALSRRLGRIISGPLLRLTATTRAMTQHHRYDVRVERGDDEIGELIDGFNSMLGEIQDRERQLHEHQDRLEQTVEARTAALRAENTDLMSSRDKAMEASRVKSEFLANMSHEIRTPMNGIIGMTELALDTEMTAQQRDFLATVKSSADSLLAVLNDILDFSKIESRKLELESVPFSVRNVVATMLKPLAAKADQKGLELVCDIDPNIPMGVLGDPVRLQQVLTNLVANAVKFTEHGHVLLEVREETRRGGSTLLHFQVSDTGIGIPPEKHATIFEAFSQADSSTTRRFGGTGLGLTISTTLVHLMGGRIWVKSEPGEGSAFHFTAAFDITELSQPGRSLDSLLAELPVLIVDDNAVNRRILHAQLTRWHTRPTEVENGRAALDALAAAAHAGRPFALVLLDVNMPDLDGFQVADQIRTRPDLAVATIMMLSSTGQPGESDRCHELGVSAYLTKPIQSNDLYDAIRRALNRKTTPQETTTAATRSVGRANHSLRVLLAEDNIVNQRVAVGLLTKRGHDVTVANNGVKALAALERRAFDVVLMDVQMPEMGGFEATAAIRAREREAGGHTRIVAMTAHAMNGDREHCLAAGMDGYLSKPIDPTMLYATLEHESGAPAGGAPASAPAAAQASAAIDREAMMTRLGGDKDLFGDVVRLFLDDCPKRLVAIKAAVNARDAEGIRTTSHALKGAAGNLSANGLFEAARTLERIGAEARLDAAEAGWRLLSAEASIVIDALRRFEVSAQKSSLSVQ